MGTESGMEPIPETTEAVEEFGPFVHNGDLVEGLQKQADAIREIVPDCVGLSVAAIEHGVTFTLVATDEEIAALDAVQYLTSGPCVEGVEAQRVIEFSPDHDLTDELGWQTFAQATAAASVASTLTLPILDGETVVGSVNLYGASTNAFEGHHEDIARIFDAWAPGAVTNADLGFTTRQVAELAPSLLREEYRIEVAAGIVATREHLDLDTARLHLLDAAKRAAVPLAKLVETLIELDGADESP